MVLSHPEEGHPLDNVVWHALRGPLARFRANHSTPDFIHFDPEVTVFSAVERVDASTWDWIAERIGESRFCALFRDELPVVPPGWEIHFQAVCLQMVAGDIPPPQELEPLLLGPDDAPDMLALAQLTEPGPFLLRTPELGRYVGIRREGRLVAMAGERFRAPGFVEVSAVCTHPDVRGEGLAAALTLDVAHSIRRGGNEAFLHVVEGNESAIRLYRKIGFAVRRKVEVVFAQWHGPDWRPSA